MATILVALSAGAAGGSVQPNTDRQAAPPGPEWLLAQAGGLPIRQIMIKFSSDLAEADLAGGAESAMLATLSRAAGEELTYVRPMSGGAHVLAIREARSPKVMAELSARLDALPEVEYAEPDLIKTIDRGETEVPQAAALVPNDPRYSDQWHYGYAAGTSEGLNLPPAWSITTGSPSTVVAVLDTGILFGHPDLAGRTVAGYDMISNTFVANDGNGRDTDPSDPGDWTLKDECPLGNDPRNSSWHGTHVAGTIGAASNNGVGVTGVNWQAKILPVRVLGKCGGDTSDIIDAVRWAAGIHVTGVPDNPNPADVINLSLGGPGACLASEQSAFDDAVAAGATVVVAAGNNSANAINFSPGNCNNIITVAATDRWGDMAWYSNYGSVVEVSAPGGETSPTKSNGILSTLNAGTTSPGAHIYEYYQGTSMATPHVAGLASLIKGLKPSFSQAQVLQVLQDNARPFPAGSTCDTSNCGAGIVDAFASVFAVAPHDLDEVSYLPLLQTPALAAKVSFGSSNFSAGEGDGQAMLIVKLDHPVGQAVSVGYSTSNGSASAGSDYVQKNAMITFSPGQISKNIAVTLLEDTKPEAAETFLVTLHTPSGAAIGSPGQATVTIWDNDQDVSVPNGDFEQGSTVWAEYSQQGWQLIVPESYLPPYASPRSGQYVAWLAGDDDEISYIQQSLTIPAGAPFLTYYHWIYSEDECGHDAAGVVVNGSEVADAYDLCWSENTGGWVKHSADLSDWAGQTVAVAIIAVTNESGLSDLFVDDVSFAGSPAPPVEANPVASVPAQQIGKRP
jgi:serine protease